jgi:hypothetical protein
MSIGDQPSHHEEVAKNTDVVEGHRLPIGGDEEAVGVPVQTDKVAGRSVNRVRAVTGVDEGAGDADAVGPRREIQLLPEAGVNHVSWAATREKRASTYAQAGA